MRTIEPILRGTLIGGLVSLWLWCLIFGLYHIL